MIAPPLRGAAETKLAKPMAMRGGGYKKSLAFHAPNLYIKVNKIKGLAYEKITTKL
jgi:hypothetical protein